MQNKCECVFCLACNGRGTVWFSFDGRYLGNSRCDDMDNIETCEECLGDGLAEICEYCQEAYDDDNY